MGKISYDNWLDNYLDKLNNCKAKILDLGSGVGNDSLYLVKKGFKVIACDYSIVALNKINQDLKEVETRLVDIVIADLSLHYFDELTTISIMKEIKRILTNNGYLIARVNSILDMNYGANKGKRIEENYYYVDGYNKRFFSIEDAKKYFSIIGKVTIKENDMLRYTKPKKVLEVLVKKNN